MNFDSSTGLTALYGEEKPTYYVIAVGGAAPTKAHHSRYKAESEANRLAIKHPGQVFDVVKLKRRVVLGEAITPPAADDKSAARAAERDKQLAAREGMGPGTWVRVRETHNTHATLIGIVERLGDGDDTSVYVRLKEGGITRFAPTSLLNLTRISRESSDKVAQHRLEAGERHDRDGGEARPVGELVAGLLGLFLKAAQEPRTEPEPDDEVQHANTIRGLAKDTEVFLILNHGGGLLPGLVTKVRFERPSGNPEAVWVCATDEGKSKLLEVHTSRIRELNDPTFTAID